MKSGTSSSSPAPEAGGPSSAESPAPIASSAPTTRIHPLKLAHHPRVDALDVVQQALGVRAQDVAHLAEVGDELHALGPDAVGCRAGIDHHPAGPLLGVRTCLDGVRLGRRAEPVGLGAGVLEQLGRLALGGLEPCARPQPSPCPVPCLCFWARIHGRAGLEPGSGVVRANARHRVDGDDLHLALVSNLTSTMAERRYDPKQIEPKWQEIWARERTWEVSNDPAEATDREKSYVLEMLPYPSGEPHIGHLKNYSLGDAIAHFHRRIGRRVLHPMGYDAFGLPAENNAIATGVHPRDATNASIAAFQRAFRSWGISIDWSRELATHEPSYYRWTQWIFLRLLERGLAYRKEAAVKWCPNDQTVLANEQVIDGRCERCGAEVEIRQLEQWFFRITDYADRLLDDLDTIQWPEHVKTMQRNWIGRSSGAEVIFTCEELGIDYPVFTTRPDTLFGVTFFVLAPEHPDVFKLAQGTDYEDQVHQYVNRALTESLETRGDAEKPKTGVPLGRTVTNPVNGEQVPMFVADYVLMEYGTGAVMGVPAHDQRDYEFALTFGLPIRPVVVPADDDAARGPGVPRPHRERTADQLRAVHRDERGRGPAGDRRLARPRGQGPPVCQLQAARLAGLTPALLGVPDPGDLLRAVRDRPGARQRPAGRTAGDR